MKQYPWAMNAQKLARAVGKKGSNATEEEIKDEYIRIGGKLANVIVVEAHEVKEVEPMDEQESVPEVKEETVTETPTEEETSGSNDVAVGTPEVEVPEETKTSTEDVA